MEVCSSYTALEQPFREIALVRVGLLLHWLRGWRGS